MLRFRGLMTIAIGVYLLGRASTALGDEITPFAIHVVDEATGRGVPLVELKTVAQRSYFTDSAGLVAIDDAALVGEETFFTVRSHGYEYPADGFGMRGLRLKIEPGGAAEVKMRRVNIAERLYRMTGAGIYEHAARLGRETPIDHPLLNAQVTGCDSTLAAMYRRKLFWVWGDTNRLSYPLGNFKVTGAVSELPAAGGLAPEVGVNFEYFGDGKGFVKGMAPFESEGPVWLTALAALKDKQGEEHLVATYWKIRGTLKVYERGLCEFDEDEKVFREVLKFPDRALVPEGHCFRHRDGGKSWLYVGEAKPRLRMPDSYESWREPDTYEAVRADADFRDARTGKEFEAHRGHVEWSERRKKWISIFTQRGGDSSYLGETWYAEAERPEGPWRKAVKIITHEKYTFYNPTQHPYFTDAEGRYLYFEGTYVTTFSGNEHPTPLYDYNQILYRVNLDDPRLEACRSSGR
jgi:hypothetical protein